MNKLRYVGADEPLTTEQGLFIKQRAVFAARRAFVARKLFGTAIRKIDAGSQTFGYDTLTEVSNAALDFQWPGRESQDIVNLARETVGIPVLHKEFEINKLDLAASNQTGTPLNTSSAESSAYKVALLEDTLLILGYAADGTTYDIAGLYNTASVNTKAGATWATGTNIPLSINGAIALLLADNIMPPYNLTLHPDQYAETLVFVANTAVSYLQWITESMQGGSVYVTPSITAGTGMMTKANPDGMFEYVMAEDLTTETEILNKQQGNNLFGRVYLRGLPVVYDANAICTITGI
ncbi:MAG: family 1 encapsulin nanocompartment shell protein [Candidatus Bathyarchaeota archaeon]|nr:family 1 encapsulin nanocompartment shell protein [Candidatus Bathyarchaeota archaeon]